MAIVETQSALEQHLATLSPLLPTAYEGTSFTPPTTMYQRVQFNVLDPDDPVLGKGYYRENQQLQIFVVDAANEGTGRAINRAELIRRHFDKGLYLTSGSLKIYVLDTPKVSGVSIIDNRVIVPVLINVVTEVTTV